MAKSLLKTFEGIDILIDSETGQFSAKIGRKEVKKRNLRDLEKEIEASLSTVIAYELDGNYPSRIQRVEITNFTGDRAREKDGRLLSSYDYLYLLDPEQLAKVEEIAEKYRQVKEEFSSFIQGLPRLRASNFAEAKEAQNNTGRKDSAKS